MAILIWSLGEHVASQLKGAVQSQFEVVLQEDCFSDVLTFRRIGKGIDNDIKNVILIIKCSCFLHDFVNEMNDSINTKWLQMQTNFESAHPREQPDPLFISGTVDPNAENIRKSIALFLCSSSTNGNSSCESSVMEELLTGDAQSTTL